MSRQDAVHVFAGCVILVSLALAHWVSPWWLLLTTLVGLNLIQWGFTKFCPAEFIFGKLGRKSVNCQTQAQ